MQATTTAPLFAAELTPHRSLTRRGLRNLIVLITVLATVQAMVFIALGAWPVVGFLGLGALGTIIALRTAMGRERRCEQVTLWTDRLEIVATDAKGDKVRSLFNPQAIRLVIDRDFNERTTALWVRTARSETQIGAFLAQDDKASLAKAFGTALRKARR
jgi:uncharacterized membrane protein